MCGGFVSFDRFLARFVLCPARFMSITGYCTNSDLNRAGVIILCLFLLR